MFKKPRSQWTQSNDSLKRCLPFALINNILPIISETSLTNPHPIKVSCNLLYITAVRWLWFGTPKEDIIPSLLNIPQNTNFYWNSTVMDVLKQVQRNEIRNVTGNTKRWVLNSFYCAFYALVNSTSFKDGIDQIIQMGGDTGTNGSIAGGMLGAYYGYTKMRQDNSK